MLVCQLGQLLHRSVGLITLENDCIEYLSHDEIVIDLFSQNILNAKVIKNLKLPVDPRLIFVRLLALGARLEQEKFLIALLFDLLQFREQESFLFGCSL